jgi:hypothetical protein
MSGLPAPQALPENPVKQEHSPVARSHKPLFEHSMSAWAGIAELLALFTQAGADGQVPENRLFKTKCKNSK